MRITKKVIHDRCGRLDLCYETSNPGDGLRYIFFDLEHEKELGYALGSREAWVWLNGYATGKGSVG